MWYEFWMGVLVIGVLLTGAFLVHGFKKGNERDLKKILTFRSEILIKLHGIFRQFNVPVDPDLETHLQEIEEGKDPTFTTGEILQKLRDRLSKRDYPRDGKVIGDYRAAIGGAIGFLDMELTTCKHVTIRK